MAKHRSRKKKNKQKKMSSIVPWAKPATSSAPKTYTPVKYTPSKYSGCTFCSINKGSVQTKMIDRKGPVMAFHNKLEGDWSATMLLVTPREHFTQKDAWTSDMIRHMMRYAVELGEKYCPQGFRLLSNFNDWGHQTIMHSHLHIVDQVDEWIDHRSQWKYTYNTQGTQRGLLTSTEMLNAGKYLVEQGEENSKGGFRIVANYYPETHALNGGPASIQVQGGHQLGFYV